MSNRIPHRFTLITAILLLFPGVSCADPVGRLFLTPEQRAAFDTIRSQGGGKLPAEEAASDQPSREITLNGIVKRSDGASTVWINQVAQSTDAIKTKARQAHPLQVPVFVAGSGKSINLKVGQTLDSETGTIRESYEPPSTKEYTAPAATPASSPAA